MVSVEESEKNDISPQDADNVVKQQKNRVYNPAVSTEEVAEELGISVERAFELLNEAPRPRGKPVGDSEIWW